MKIRRELLEALIEAAKETHPDEFFALLTGKKGVIEEFVFVPFESGENFAVFNLDLIPLGMKVYGTVHSHPSPNPYPSQADVRTFSLGRVHIIIHYPYCRNCWKAYDRNGEEIEIEVVD